MTIALAGCIGWLLMLTAAVCMGAAAKRGDELADSARRDQSVPQTDAQIIPFVRRTTATVPSASSAGRRVQCGPQASS